MKRYITDKSYSLTTSNNTDSFNTLKSEMTSKSLQRLKDKNAKDKYYRNKEKRIKKKIKRLKKQLRQKRLDAVEILFEERADRLEANLPASERWFRELYFKEDITRNITYSLYKDEFNRPFNTMYIPDVCNRGYRYLIEIDGGYHNTPTQQAKDFKRDYYFHKRGYITIRIKDRDMESYKAGIEAVRARIKEIEGLSNV